MKGSIKMGKENKKDKEINGSLEVEKESQKRLVTVIIILLLVIGSISLVVYNNFSTKENDVMNNESEIVNDQDDIKQLDISTIETDKNLPGDYIELEKLVDKYYQEKQKEFRNNFYNRDETKWIDIIKSKKLRTQSLEDVRKQISNVQVQQIEYFVTPQLLRYGQTSMQ